VIEQWFARLALIFMFSCFVLLGYWWFIDGAWTPMITFQDSRVDKTVFHQGDTMVISRTMCFSDDINFVIHRSFVDGLAYQLADYVTAADAGCRKRSIGIEIPFGLPPGSYRFKAWAALRINPIKTIKVMYPELPEITVLERTP